MPSVPSLQRRTRAVLNEVFGLDRFRPGQAEVIARVQRGRSTLAIMPTGAGKSLCYQLPALVSDLRVLVISPLIALMKDQCDALCARGVDALQLHSDLTGDEAALADERLGHAAIVFATPERAADPAFVARLRAAPPGLIAIDEAHCISQWGHDFRPAYRELGRLAPALGHPPVLALTATADDRVAADIAATLSIAPDDIVRTGVYRANLHYRVEPMDSEEAKTTRALALLHEAAGSGIVYASTISGAVALHQALSDAGESVALYHGRLGAAERRASQERFLAGDARLMVATCAFGMGIDKPDVRFVVHLQLPSSLDAYYQESGRAGRDGADAVCTLLYLRRDRAVQAFMLAGRSPTRAALRTLLDRLGGAPPEGGAGEQAGWTAAALAKAAHLPLGQTRSLLGALIADRLVQRGDRGLTAPADADEDRLDRLLARDAAHRREAQQKLEQMVFYAQAGSCRWQILLRHFGAGDEARPCGHCDSCVRRRLFDAQAAASEPQPPEPARSSGPAWGAGHRVKVRRYGAGEVVQADAGSVTVRFADGAERCFDPGFVKPIATPSRRPRKVAAAVCA